MGNQDILYSYLLVNVFFPKSMTGAQFFKVIKTYFGGNNDFNELMTFWAGAVGSCRRWTQNRNLESHGIINGIKSLMLAMVAPDRCFRTYCPSQ